MPPGRVHRHKAVDLLGVAGDDIERLRILQMVVDVLAGWMEWQGKPDWPLGMHWLERQHT